jgi:hypothetical protein
VTFIAKSGSTRLIHGSISRGINQRIGLQLANSFAQAFGISEIKGAS